MPKAKIALEAFKDYPAADGMCEIVMTTLGHAVGTNMDGKQNFMF